MPDLVNDSTLSRTVAHPAAARRGTASAILRATRPRQWIKNSVIFAALVFSQTMTDADHLLRSVAAFILFCGISGAVYLVNDVLDLPNDRIHPTKSRRPVASGELSVGAAVTAGVILGAGGLALSWVLNPAFAALGLLYVVNNLLYSMWLKRVVIVDVMIIASGFVIRAVAGGFAIGVEVSAWLILCTILLSLFLGFTKRRQELAQLESLATEHRAALRDYSIVFLDQMISIVTAATLIAYFLYTLAPETSAKLGTPWLPLTIPFVLYGVFRYLFLVHRRNMGESPTTALYADRALMIDVVLWAAAAVAVLYWR